VASYRETIRENQKFGDMSPFISLCDDAIRCLDQPQCIEAIRNETSLLAFVHGDYNYRNLIIDKQGAIHLIDFENTSLQVRMVDLAHVLHRNVAWKGEETLRWIDNYDRVRPLSSEDRHLLFALLLVPYPLVRAIRQNRNIQSIQNAMPRTKMIEPYIHHLRKLI
jgi:thiamine kinase-like enzyme